MLQRLSLLKVKQDAGMECKKLFLLGGASFLFFYKIITVTDLCKFFHIMFAIGRKNGILILGNHECL